MLNPMGVLMQKFEQPRTAAEARAYVAKMNAQARARSAGRQANKPAPAPAAKRVVPMKMAPPPPKKPLALAPAPTKAKAPNVAEIYTAMNALHNATPEARDKFNAEAPLHGLRSNESRLRLAAEGQIGARW